MAERRRKTLLVVDDELLFLRTIADGFLAASSDLQVLTAHNGRVAMEVLGRTPVDLVVTDLNMPEVDGFELLAYLSREHPHTPVLVMTAFGTPEIEERLRGLGVSQYLDKPLEFRQLAERVNEALEASATGHLQGITLATFLQMIAMERKSCCVLVESAGRSGELCFQGGELVHARTGPLDGEYAAMEIVCWERPSIDITASSPPRTRTVKMPLAEILLDAFRRQDETERGVEPQDIGEQHQSDYLALSGEVAHAINTTTIQEENMAGPAQEKLKELGSSIDGFIGVALYTPAGELLAHHSNELTTLKDVGVLANNVLMNAQKASLEMGTGRGQQVHIEGERTHILARCLNEGTDPLRSQPGKSHIHMVVVLKPDAPIGLAKLRINNALERLADDFRM